MPGSHVEAVVDVAVDALRAAQSPEALGAKVYTHVPQGTEPPYAWVLGGEEIPWVVEFGDDNGARQIDLLVTLVSTYRGTKEVDRLASVVLEVLLDDDSWEQLEGYEQVEFVRNTAQPPADLLQDGVLWFLRTVVVRLSVQ